MELESVSTALDVTRRCTFRDKRDILNGTGKRLDCARRDDEIHFTITAMGFIDYNLKDVATALDVTKQPCLK